MVGREEAYVQEPCVCIAGGGAGSKGGGVMGFWIRVRGGSRQTLDRVRRPTGGCCCHGLSWSVRGARLAAGTHVQPVLPRSRTASR